MTNNWGRPTWLFLHTFIEKMDPTFYINNKSIIIAFIKRICNNLPCNICDKHARKYLINLTPSSVPTKLHMEQFLFTFHNNVNKRIQKPIFVDTNMYRLAKLRPIFTYFSKTYPINSALSKNFIDSRGRKKTVDDIRKFINEHTNQFKW